jgi:peroxiredoxin/signal peptidase I
MFLHLGISCLLIGLLWWLVRWFLVIITVEQWSMFPTLQAGDRLLAMRHWPANRLRKGQVVILAVSPGDDLYIKRVVALSGEIYQTSITNLTAGAQFAHVKHKWHIPPEHFFVCGDNAKSSTDSRYWGPLPFSSLRGRVLIRLPHRASGASILRMVLPPEWASLSSDALSLVGQPAPAFTAETLDGETVTLANYARHSYALLCFAPTAPECRTLLPMLEWACPQIYTAGAELLLISLDQEAETRACLRDIQLHLQVLLLHNDVDTFKYAYGIQQLPCWYGVDACGCIMTQSEAMLLATNPPVLWRSSVIPT